MEECFWTLVEWVWQDNKAHIAPYDAANNTDNRLVVVGSEDKRRVVLKCIGPREHYHTLGVYITSEGNYKRQVNILKQQIKIWSAQVLGSTLNKEETRVA